jgi:hypothetical protein
MTWRSNSRLQHLAHSHISITHNRLLCLSQHHHFKLNYFRIYFLDNKIEKIIIYKFKIQYIK